MHTVTADKYKRVRLPDAKPGQVFAYYSVEGNITLTVVKKTERRPVFPRGSLLKYFTGELGRQRNAEETAIGSGCLQGPS